MSRHIRLDSLSWESRAIKAEEKVKALNARLQNADRLHAEAFAAGSRSGRNDAFTLICRGLNAQAERLESTGGFVESTCAKVLRRAAAGVSGHIIPLAQSVEASDEPSRS